MAAQHGTITDVNVNSPCGPTARQPFPPPPCNPNPTSQSTVDINYDNGDEQGRRAKVTSSIPTLKKPQTPILERRGDSLSNFQEKAFHPADIRRSTGFAGYARTATQRRLILPLLRCESRHQADHCSNHSRVRWRGGELDELNMSDFLFANFEKEKAARQRLGAPPSHAAMMNDDDDYSSFSYGGERPRASLTSAVPRCEPDAPRNLGQCASSRSPPHKRLAAPCASTPSDRSLSRMTAILRRSWCSRQKRAACSPRATSTRSLLEPATGNASSCRLGNQ